MALASFAALVQKPTVKLDHVLALLGERHPRQELLRLLEVPVDNSNGALDMVATDFAVHAVLIEVEQGSQAGHIVGSFRAGIGEVFKVATPRLPVFGRVGIDYPGRLGVW